MTVKELLFNHDLYKTASVFIFINRNNELVSFTTQNPISLDSVKNLNVNSAKFDSVTSNSFLTSGFFRNSDSDLIEALSRAIAKFPKKSYALVLQIHDFVETVVVTEKYFSDGTHYTDISTVRTSVDNISESFASNDDCDIFVKPFPSINEAQYYLRSKFYIDLVEQRTRNRLAKRKSSPT